MYVLLYVTVRISVVCGSTASRSDQDIVWDKESCDIITYLIKCKQINIGVIFELNWFVISINNTTMKTF